MDYLRSFLSFIFAISIMYMLLDCRIKDKKHYYLLGSFLTIIISFDIFILLNYGYGNFMKFYPLLVHLPTFIVFLFISKFKGTKVFFVLLTLVAISTSFTLIGVIIFLVFDSSRDLINIISFILYVPVGIFIYKYIRPSFLYMLNNTDKGWLGFSLIPLSYYMIIYSIAKYDLNNLAPGAMARDALLLSVLTLSAYYLILRFFKQTREHLILKSEQDLLKTQVTSAQTHLEEIQNSQQKTLIYRHDMRHHLSLINSYLSDNNQDGAAKYIAEVEKSIDETIVEKFCNNYTVNLILSSYIKKAKNENIKVETEIDLPEKTDISDMDLCVIFANAIENAVNACKAMPDGIDRNIKIVCKMNNNSPLIQITNSFDGNVAFIQDMPVRADNTQGLGTKSIAAVVQKYKGICSFSVQDGIFQTSIIL